MIDESTSIPIKVDDITIAIVNKDGSIHLSDISSDKLYEAVSKYHDLASLDPAIFTLISAVVTQAVVIRNLSRAIEELRTEARKP